MTPRSGLGSPPDVVGNDGEALRVVHRRALVCWLCVLQTLTAFAVSPPKAERYGDSIADFLNYRPHQTDPDVAESVLICGREQGVPGLEDGTAAQRESRRAAVHEFIARTFFLRGASNANY